MKYWTDNYHHSMGYINDGFIFYTYGYKYSSKKVLCLFLLRSLTQNFPLNPMRISIRINIQISIHALFLSLSLYFPNLSIQNIWMGKIRIESNKCNCRRCGLTKIPTSSLLQLYLVLWWMMCGRNYVTSLKTEISRITLVLGFFQKNCMSKCYTNWIQTFH